MIGNLQDVWNKSHTRIPKDKQASSYAIEKEKLFSRNSLICDLGGGTGVDTVFFLKNGHMVTLVDISDFALKAATEKARDLHLLDHLKIQRVDLNIRKIPFPDNFFDCVFSRMTLHYFDWVTTQAILKEIYRILKPNGTAYLTLKSSVNKEDAKVTIDEGVEKEPGVFIAKDGQIKSRFSIDQLNKMLLGTDIDFFEVKEYKEQLGGRIDVIKSGVKEMVLNEIVIRKKFS